MKEKYFVELKKLYADFKKIYKTRADEQRKITCSQIKSKGRMCDVFPYQAERIGKRTKGKVVKEIEMKDDNFIFYFDENNRIRLVEEACTFLKKICDYECYEYMDNKIYAYCGALSGVKSISIGVYKNNKLMEKYTLYSLERYAYEKYIYKNDLLCYIETYVYEERKETRQWKERFYFKQKSDLQLIQRVEGSWRENRYSTVKINNKKLESNVENHVNGLSKKMFGQVRDMKDLVLGLNLNLENDISDIDFFFEFNGEVQKLNSEYNLLIRDLPLDNEEKEKVVNCVLKALIRLWDEKYLDEQVGLKIIKNGINVLSEKRILPRWVQRNPQLVFDVDMIRYQYLDKKKSIEEKKIKEIFKDFKRSINKDMSLTELVTCFEEMSKVPAKDASYEFLEDMFFIQAETVTYKSKLMFGFSLIRQIPYKEEFIHLGMEVILELNDANKLMSHSCWNEDVKGDFFSYVRGTDVYTLNSNNQVHDVRVFVEEI